MVFLSNFKDSFSFVFTRRVFIGSMRILSGLFSGQFIAKIALMTIMLDKIRMLYLARKVFHLQRYRLV